MNLTFHLNMMFYKIILKIIVIINNIIKMFFRFRNILSKHQINKRFFSNNCNNICKINIEELNNLKNMITYIQILSTINYFITFIILLK
jgi:hypothetical protein